MTIFYLIKLSRLCFIAKLAYLKTETLKTEIVENHLKLGNKTSHLDDLIYSRTLVSQAFRIIGLLRISIDHCDYCTGYKSLSPKREWMVEVFYFSTRIF